MYHNSLHIDLIPRDVVLNCLLTNSSRRSLVDPLSKAPLLPQLLSGGVEAGSSGAASAVCSPFSWSWVHHVHHSLALSCQKSLSMMTMMFRLFVSSTLWLKNNNAKEPLPLQGPDRNYFHCFYLSKRSEGRFVSSFTCLHVHVMLVVFVCVCVCVCVCCVCVCVCVIPALWKIKNFNHGNRPYLFVSWSGCLEAVRVSGGCWLRTRHLWWSLGPCSQHLCMTGIALTRSVSYIGTRSSHVDIKLCLSFYLHMSYTWWQTVKLSLIRPAVM